MTNPNGTPTPTFTNPLQNNNTALMIIGYIAGICAAKFTFFDLATWNYIIMSLGGVVFAAWTFISNRKSAVIAATAKLPEVKGVELDKTVQGATTMANVTLANVENVVSK